jgi:hypothetical protein
MRNHSSFLRRMAVARALIWSSFTSSIPVSSVSPLLPSLCQILELKQKDYHGSYCGIYVKTRDIAIAIVLN